MKKFLIVGLGNIGPEYENTRHNIGFKVLDQLAEDREVSFKADKLASRTEFKNKGRTFVLIKPSTYMNLSGKAVRYWMEKEKVELEQVLIVTDDLALPFGTLRIKLKGSDGGHNGLKNINEVLNTTKYARFRFGISAEFGKGGQVDYVLGEWSAEENEKLGERIKKAGQAVVSFGMAGAARTMNQFNGQ